MVGATGGTLYNDGHIVRRHSRATLYGKCRVRELSVRRAIVRDIAEFRDQQRGAETESVRHGEKERD